MNLWWVCVVAGVVLVGVEIFAPGLVALWFGVAALATAIPVALGAPFWVDLVTFGASLAVLVQLSRPITDKLVRSAEGRRDTNADALVGLTGVVAERVDPASGRGLVRVGTELWSAISETGEHLEAGCSVRVTALRGARVVVRKEGAE